ncbi:very short patch repair endonuclease [Microbulbifer sp. EKSA005]|uniref:very short patch repair endonuclease n=1 Tax=Microbulbifer sp. EKSA005 TaxID=3243364 RepID=UPI004042FCFE
MIDIVEPAIRSRMMAAITSRNTKPELIVRKSLHARGFRYRLHDKKLPGKPDIVLPKYRVAIEVRGCFWHRHLCKDFKWPKTRKQFWKEKLETNQRRDIQNRKTLENLGWRVLVVWECAIRSKTPEEISVLMDTVSKWIKNSSPIRDIPS